MIFKSETDEQGFHRIGAPSKRISQPYYVRDPDKKKDLTAGEFTELLDRVENTKSILRDNKHHQALKALVPCFNVGQQQVKEGK